MELRKRPTDEVTLHIHRRRWSDFTYTYTHTNTLFIQMWTVKMTGKKWRQLNVVECWLIYAWERTSKTQQWNVKHSSQFKKNSCPLGAPSNVYGRVEYVEPNVILHNFYSTCPTCLSLSFFIYSCCCGCCLWIGEHGFTYASFHP